MTGKNLECTRYADTFTNTYIRGKLDYISEKPFYLVRCYVYANFPRPLSRKNEYAWVRVMLKAIWFAAD